MRLIGVALLALVGFALVALLAENREVILTDLGINPRSGDHRYVKFETSGSSVDEILKTPGEKAELHIRQYREWLAVAGFSSNQIFSLPLLRETAFSSGIVTLDLAAQLADDTNGRLRVFVNGLKRGEIVLEPGSEKYRLDTPLAPQDLNLNWVEVQIDASGSNPKAMCSDDWDGGMIVSVEPTTKVTLFLDEEITSATDLILTSGSPAKLVWNNPTQGTQSQPERHTQHDVPWSWPPSLIDAQFYDFDTAPASAVNLDLSEILELRTKEVTRSQLVETLSPEVNKSWPVPVIGETDTVELREFRNKGSWSYKYNLRDLPDGELPSQVKLDLKFSTALPGQNWLYLVTLNGLIVHNETISGSEETLNREIPLPADIQSLENTLRVSLTSDEAKEGRCTQGAPAAAQILPSSEFDNSGYATRPALNILVDRISDEMNLFVSPDVDAIEANQAFLTIGKIFQTTNVNSILTTLQSSAAPHNGVIAVIDKKDLDIVRERAKDNPSSYWLAFSVFDAETSPEVKIYRADDSDLPKAIELYRPEGLVVVAEPGTW